MEHYGIIGHPIAHSLSPLMHNRAFEILGRKARYDAHDILPEELSAAVARLATEGIAGFNVTIPHKHAILSALQRIDEAAQQVGAVNTVVNRDGSLFGTNTDVYGVLQTLLPVANRIRHANVMVIGAGGSARAVLFSLLKDFGPSEINIVTRTIAKAEALALHFQPLAPGIPIRTFTTSNDVLSTLVASSTLLINTSPVGMAPHDTASPLPAGIGIRSDQIVFDLIYTPLQTTLLR
ncbi:MAG: shikimate dehydrogenase, partial [Bacteroidota bacterium]